MRKQRPNIRIELVTLTGNDGADYLEGEAGDDTLSGGQGEDTLWGGAGNDTYLLDGKDGATDTIEDADGEGSLILNGTVLQGGEAAGEGRWINKTQSTVFTLLGQGENARLIIQNDARPGQIHLRHWKNGQLGLTMQGAPAPKEIQRTAYDLSIEEDKYAYKSIRPEQAGNMQIVNAIDVARGGLAGGYGGEDLIVGDTAAQPDYAVILDGGAGNDIVWAGEQKTSIQQAMADGETETPNGRDNVLLNGHVGDDQLIGDAGHDVLFGGEGHDTLVGGEGADIIIADGEGIGLNTGGTSSGFAWALGGDPDQISSLHLNMGIAKVETAKADSTGRKLRVIHNIGMSVSPLANTDMSGLLAMEAKEQPDGSVIWTNYADLHGGHYFGTNVGKGNDVIYAGAGNDAVNAGAGDDFVQAGSGKDQVAGYGGNDFILGDTSDDLILGDAPLRDASGGVSGTVFGVTWTSQFQLDAALHGQDILDGGEGNDTLIGGGSRDVLRGGAGNDTLVGDDLEGLADGSHTGGDFLDGGDSNDVLFGDDSVEQPANARGGNDTLIAGMGEDVLYGGNGNDILNASEEDNANDDLYGEAGDDTLYGGTGEDILDGGEGDDRLHAGKGGNTLIGGGGNDALWSGTGDDNLKGDAGNDVFHLGRGNDVIEDASGEDTYFIDPNILKTGVPGTVTTLTDADGKGRLYYGSELLAPDSVRFIAENA